MKSIELIWRFWCWTFGWVDFLEICLIFDEPGELHWIKRFLEIFLVYWLHIWYSPHQPSRTKSPEPHWAPHKKTFQVFSILIPLLHLQRTFLLFHDFFFWYFFPSIKFEINLCIFYSDFFNLLFLCQSRKKEKKISRKKFVKRKIIFFFMVVVRSFLVGFLIYKNFKFTTFSQV